MRDARADPYRLPPGTVVFVGPSLSHADRLVERRHLRPPAERGDIAREVEQGAHHILLIDGLMVHRYGPSPTEVYEAIGAGARVLGAASLGALRAVELRDLGMVGVGWVYGAYRTGLTDADDEVLAVCDPETWRPLSVSAIRVRYALHQLVASGCVQAEQAHKCMVELRRRPVEERSPATVSDCAAHAGISPGLRSRLLDARYDVKGKDARRALRILATPTEPAVVR